MLAFENIEVRIQTVLFVKLIDKCTFTAEAQRRKGALS
jgi:hypothetical protein